VTENNKGREFWIIGPITRHSCYLDEKDQVLTFDPKDPCIHVISYEAYQQALDEITKLKAENEELKIVQSEAERVYIKEYNQNEKLTEALRVAREALNDYALEEEYDGDIMRNCGKAARKGIAKIDELLR
jgi:hypothetical protein